MKMISFKLAMKVSTMRWLLPPNTFFLYASSQSSESIQAYISEMFDSDLKEKKETKRMRTRGEKIKNIVLDDHEINTAAYELLMFTHQILAFLIGWEPVLNSGHNRLIINIDRVLIVLWEMDYVDYNDSINMANCLYFYVKINILSPV